MQQLGSVIVAVLLFACILVSQEALASSDFVPPAVAYSPRTYSPAPGTTPLSRKQIIADLKLLVATGFRSLVTYSAEGLLGSIPEIARRVGFDGIVVMGIWDPSDDKEWENALSQAPFVNGYCVGNEGLDVRYSEETLSRRMVELRHATGLPVTTSEPIYAYLSGEHRDWLLLFSDWLFPIAHSYWASKRNSKDAVDWLIARHDYLVSTTQKVVVIKEAGVPSTGMAYDGQDAQIAFFESLESFAIPFFYFEAFDQPWKRDVEYKPEVEAHWGLFDAQGNPKEVVGWIANRWRE